MSTTDSNRNYDIHLMRMRGYSDGSGARPINPELESDSNYIFGYSWGQREKRNFSELSADSLGLNLHAIHTNKNA